MDPDRVRKFHEDLFSWWEENRRDFPWRQTTDPYRILVSEFMLQQTQTSRVVPKYLAFLEEFRDMQTLASAKMKDVLRLWIGLGYNRRAMWLRDACIELSRMKEFPQDFRTLLKIKGIGSYTARSILVFAYNVDLAAVDTNVQRVLKLHGFIDEKMGKKEVQTIADFLIPKGKSSDYHNALMDYGAVHRVYKERKKSKVVPFEKSNRYYRGKILKFLVEHEGSSFESIAQEVQLSQKKLMKIIDQLSKENYVLNQNNQYYLAT